MNKYITGLFILFVFAGCNSGHNVSDNSKQIATIDYCDEKVLDSIGKLLIPYLIDSISINRKAEIVGYVDSKSSTFQKFQINNYYGINYAFDIECILGLNQLIQKKTMYNIPTICSIHLYEFGVILSREHETNEYDTLKYSDIINIQEIYREWWSKNKDRPLDSLQKDWDNNIRPLNSNCGYFWK